MFATCSTRWMKGALVACFALAIGAPALLPHGAQAQGFSFLRNDVRTNDRAQPRIIQQASRTMRPAPAATLDPQDVPLPAKPTVPRPRGSDAQICANQTEELAQHRIDACGKIIGTGRLSGESLGVAYALRGLAYLDRDDIVHSIGDFNRAIGLAPNFAPAYQNRGNAWYARGNYGSAIADYDKAIALDPEHPSPYINRAAVKRDLGHNDGALADYQKAISLRGNHANSYSGRGLLYLRQKDYARATGDFDQAVKYDPSAANYMLRAQAREANGDLDAALRDVQEAARIDPKSLAALNAQAALWRKKGDIDKAIAVLDRAIPLDENPSQS